MSMINLVPAELSIKKFYNLGAWSRDQAHPKVELASHVASGGLEPGAYKETMHVWVTSQQTFDVSWTSG